MSKTEKIIPSKKERDKKRLQKMIEKELKGMDDLHFKDFLMWLRTRGFDEAEIFLEGSFSHPCIYGGKNYEYFNIESSLDEHFASRGLSIPNNVRNLKILVGRLREWKKVKKASM